MLGRRTVGDTQAVCSHVPVSVKEVDGVARTDVHGAHPASSSVALAAAPSTGWQRTYVLSLVALDLVVIGLSMLRA
jgi:hypothetical protein